MTITFNFKNGLQGTLTHNEPQKIRKWLGIFGTPEAMDACDIDSISVSMDGQETAQEAA